MLIRLLHLSIFLSSLSLNVLAQDISNKQIQLLNKNDKPLIGATVQRYSMLTDEFLGGTLSDVKGMIVIPDLADQKIVISYLGYKTKDVVIEDWKEEMIYLEVDSYQMKEIVIVSLKSTKIKCGLGLNESKLGYKNSIVTSIEGYLKTKINNAGKYHTNGSNTNNVKSLSNWKYYPNPTIHQVTIESKAPSGEIILYALDGREIFRKGMTHTIETIQLSNYPAASYILTHYNAGVTDIIGKVIKV